MINSYPNGLAPGMKEYLFYLFSGGVFAWPLWEGKEPFEFETQTLGKGGWIYKFRRTVHRRGEYTWITYQQIEQTAK
jgi:hypothetical protein